MTKHDKKPNEPATHAKVLWQQPLLLREKIEAEYENRDKFLRSLPELEAAFSLCVSDPHAQDIDVLPDAAKKALEFYNLVVKDGRYIELLKDKPEEAAQKLRINLGPEIAAVLRQGLNLRGAHSRVNEFTVVTAIVATLALSIPEAEVVIDHSKQVQLKV